MKQYYYVDLHEGCMFGTDDVSVALDFSYSEDHYVLDGKEGKQLVDGKLEEVEDSPYDVRNKMKE